MLEVPVLVNTRYTWLYIIKKNNEQEYREQYIFPFIHWASSTISKLEWIMNWFMYCAVSGNRNRAMPSPPLFDVPKAILNSGASLGDRIVK